ncbi:MULTISPECIES: LacI family DNA-binding transcriptional regulator [unclassified Microbacterium]|uniref:LacI family DNA-binding transcriptional regulator n=1 Tax=unclassified Microbacterium TaxID=2609290 RepID=UPI000F54EFE8|nr:LacI family DNA-binding transcriptional regulator [Microbacterium sp. ABRD28]AZC14954.1 LacI family DNA-binding transcriptional regulator [Microbacterium sp. ABRD28]
MSRPRISDVAAAAGVSVTTVSLVMNDVESRISETTRQRVREAAVAVGYAPSSVARSLRTRQTRTVGLISDQIATTPFAGRMLAGAQDAARENGHLVIFVDTGGDEGVERDAISALRAQQVDAMIYACMWHRVVEVPESLPAGSVFLDCRPVNGGFPSVVPADREGGYAATRVLIEAGHRRIAFLDTSDGPIASFLRLEGYHQALTDAGIPIDPALHIRGGESTAHGARLAAERLLDLPADQRPTGIFSFNDRMAVGVYNAAHRRGLRIPDDLSVVGYDDQLLVAAEQDPPLTTVALPHYEMGRWAMEVALGVRADGNTDATHRMECPVIRRESVGPPPAHVAKQSRRRTT